MAKKKKIKKDPSWSADSRGKIHDGISDPVPRRAARKTVVDRVIGSLIGAGNSLVSLVSGLLAMVLILYSGYVLVDTVSVQRSAQKTAWDLMAFKPELIDDYNAALSAPQLKNINKDYRAWVTVYDTNIDYPVVQGENDLYYASHDIYNQSSLTGAIYLAAGNTGDFSDSYNLLYGHHMDNGGMFGGLDAFADPDYLREHRDGIIVTDSGIYNIVFFAAARTDAYENRIYRVGNRMEEVLAFLESGGAGGIGVGTKMLSYNTEAVRGAQKLIALSTCADTETNGRMVVFGVMKQRQLLTLEAEGYEGIYDGKAHTLTSVTVNFPDDALVEYSLDGETWTDTMPVITDVGTLDVRVRATSEEYGSANTLVQLKVNPAPILITTGSARKIYDGTPLTAQTATVLGLVNGESVTLEATGSQTEVGSSSNPYRIVWDGALASNYTITEQLGSLAVSPVPAETTSDVPAERPGRPDERGGSRPGTEIVPPARPEGRTASLVIRYQTIDGETAAPSYEKEMEAGSRYTVASPAIDGYVVLRSLVEGTLTEDTEITVLYVPASAASVTDGGNGLIVIDEAGTPLGLGTIYVNTGDCWD